MSLIFSSLVLNVEAYLHVWHKLPDFKGGFRPSQHNFDSKQLQTNRINSVCESGLEVQL